MDGAELTAFIRTQRSEAAQSNAPLKDIRIQDLLGYTTDDIAALKASGAM